jgi:hypothetical protein
MSQNQNPNPKAPAEGSANPLENVSTDVLIAKMKVVYKDWEHKVWVPKSLLEELDKLTIPDDRIKVLTIMLKFFARDMTAKPEKEERPSLLDLLK